MKCQTNIGCNLWSIKEHLLTVDDADKSLGRLAEAGYGAVELCRMDELPDLPTMKRLCEQHGLAVCGLHDMTVLDDSAAALAAAQSVGSDFVSYPYPLDRDLADPDQVAKLAADLNAAGRVLHEDGILLTYHNHQVEFAHTGGAMVLDRLIAETDPLAVQFQLDLYWVQFGGCNPVQWCNKLADRLPQVHVKDYVIGADGQPRSCAIGKGNMPWQELSEQFAGRQLIIEQEHYTADPFNELTEGVRFLSKLGA